MADVIVLGAGIAGLATAERLASAGRSVLLIEARHRVGGRIHTLRPPAFPHPIELGAEFVHGESPELWDLIRRAGLAFDEVPQRQARRHNGAPSPVPPMETLVEQVLGPNPEQAPDRPFRELLQDHLDAGMGQAEAEAVLHFVEGFHAADPERIGSRALADGGSPGRGKQFRLREGYGALVSWLAGRLQSLPVDLRLEATVSGVRWRPGEVRIALRLPRGKSEEIRAPRVLLTLPLAILKGDGLSVAQLPIEPYPAGWSRALERLHMGTVRRIVLRFDRRWWDSGSTAGVNFFHGAGEPFPVWWTAAPATAEIITGWVGGPPAEAFSGQPEDRVIEAALLSLASIFGAGVDRLRRWLVDAFTYDWASDPHTAGAYCYGGVGAIEAQQALSIPVADTLFLAGEALAHQGGIGTVHGALASGLRAADALLGPAS